jgi:transposase
MRIGIEVGLARAGLYLPCTIELQAQPGQYPAIAAVHQKGLTQREISEHLQIPFNTNYDCLKAQDYTPNSTALSSCFTVLQAILERHEQGLTPREIAEVLGVTVQTVYMHLRHQGTQPSASSSSNPLATTEELSANIKKSQKKIIDLLTCREIPVIMGWLALIYCVPPKFADF